MATAAFLTLGLGAVPKANAQLLMKGSDTLEDVAKDAIAAAGLSAAITYVGGGSGGGQGAMTSTPPTQQIAPMSRQLNSTACTTLGATIGQELIGLDGIAIVAGNQPGGDSDEQTASTADDCNDNISGGTVLAVPGCTTADGCDASGNYTFTDWKDVLAVVYAGQNHTSAAQLISGARNPARINCGGAVRRTLVDNWGALFQNGTGAQSCRTGACTKLRHAFRRDDISGTTDTFVGLVGLVAIPPYTTAFDASPVFLPKPDAAATANPFCNAGEKKMNKGDSDYLDLDPIRRATDQQSGTRLAFEQVGEGSLPAFGGNNNDTNCTDGDSTVSGIQAQVPPTDSSSSSAPNVLPSQVITGSTAALQDELGFPAGGAAVTKPNTRVCLGLVLPIVVPGNYTSEDAFFGANASTAPVQCSIDPVTGTTVRVNKIIDTTFTASLCPDGKPQPCLVPVNNSTGTNNFNCYVAGLNPALLPLRTNTGYNLHPLTSAGLFKRDNYVNPNIPISGGIPAARQNRVVTAFMRLHFNQVTNLNGSAPTLPAGQFCRQLSATNQIGCLVKANTCTIGFAGREGVDPNSVADNFAFKLNNIAPSKTNIQNLVTTAALTDDYPLARGLYVNSVIGFSAVTGNELTLLNYVRNPANIDPIIIARNFVEVPAGVTRSTGCPR
jgi:hypothetical protein